MKRCILTLSCLLAPSVFAQYMLTMAPDKAAVAVDEPVKIVITFQERENIWCGLQVNFGDGEIRDLRVEQTPLTLTKRYDRPGRFEIHAQGRFLNRGLKSAVGCPGNDQTTFVEVKDAIAEAARQAEVRELERRRQELADKERQLRQRELQAQERLAAAQAAAAAAAAQASAAGAAGSVTVRPPRPPGPAPTPPAARPAPTAPAAKPKDKTLEIF